MLVNQLTSVVLETTNPNIDDGLSKKERIIGYSSLKFPKCDSQSYQVPSAEDPNVYVTLTEEKILIPFALLNDVKGSFTFGKKVEYPLFKCVEQMHEYAKGSEEDLSAFENQFPDDNNFIDSLILGVYFHSLIRKNQLDVSCKVIRNTDKKFNLDLKFTVKNFYVKIIRVSGSVEGQFFYQMNDDDYDYFELEVAIRHSHSRSSEKSQSRKSKDITSSDGEVSDLELVNVGIEETER